MADCPYCERSLADEATLRRHLYEDHEYDDLGRIDARRVDQYVDDHGLEESADDATRDQSVADEGERPVSTTDRDPDEWWEFRDVEALSTTEITDRLAEYGITTAETSFRDRAADADAARDLVPEWVDDYDVEPTGYDWEFLSMAATVLWKRWTPELPSHERIDELFQEGQDLRESGNDAEACQCWLTAWEMIVAVLPEEITTVDEADDHLSAVLSLEAFLRTLDSDLATLSKDDPTYHERRLDFCRGVCTQFPDAADELLLDFRHFVADSLAELGSVADSRSELEALTRDFPGDPWAYKKLADSYWQEPHDELSVSELERGVTLYQQALDAETPLERPSIVSDRLDDLERRLADAESSESRDR